MAANVRTEMRIPTRSAPRPPVNSVPQRNNVWGSTNDIFRAGLMPQSVQKKKPPPRPPPPKFTQHHTYSQKEQKPKKPARPTELLTNLFGRKNTKQEQTVINRTSVHFSNTISQSSNTNGTVSLIDLSPPGSPTFTTRSSSDGVSIDSFGSDGNSNPSLFTSSGNTSQTESAFEDDFDFFGMSSKSGAQNDPWQMKPAQDPFGPIEVNVFGASNTVKQVGETSFFAFNNDVSKTSQVPFGQSNLKPAVSMPTIIRAKPPKPPPPKIMQKKMETAIKQEQEKLKSLSSSMTPFNLPVPLNVATSWDDVPDNNPSPPMPTIPPPMPPTEYLSHMDGDLPSQQPYGIALYDFPKTHPDDLALKEGDTVTLVKVINDDWMEGRVGDCQGMFPTNFVDVKVPLPELENVVTALYSFKAEAPADLSFEEGARITVLSRISDDWLYGECGGKRGQFPANYVNRIPRSITKSF